MVDLTFPFGDDSLIMYPKLSSVLQDSKADLELLILSLSPEYQDNRYAPPLLAA